MINAEKYLKSLNDKSVWVFTKQKTSDFDETIKVTSFFDNIPDKETTNIEMYFKNHHNEYNIETDRHRTLVISQFFGLITKTPFYKRGVQYNKEKTTAIYNKLKNINPLINSDEYNKIKTEQILKLKIHAIIDTGKNNEEYHILPVIFIYKVLKELQMKHNIKVISLEQLYTYVMTCKNYSQWMDAVEYIKTNAPVSEHVKRYKDYSRVMTLIRNNIKLFDVDTQKISINTKFDEYFYINFMQKYDMEELNEVLYREVDYSYFLYNIQEFNVNLIDEPQQDASYGEVKIQKEKQIIKTETTEDEIDENYIDKIDEIDEKNVNVDVAEGAHKIPPTHIDNKEISKKYRRNPLLGKIAIQNAYYSCEKDVYHKTFESDKTNKEFMEAHHLVPVKYQQEIWINYHVNVDCVENIVSLCPTCHRAFHNGTKDVKKQMIENIYEKLVPRYKSIGFNISVDEIKKLYNT